MVNTSNLQKLLLTHTTLFDSHTHNTPQFNNHIYIRNRDLSEQPSAPFTTDLFSAGIHPWNAEHLLSPESENILKSEKLIAIGETGIDRIRPIHIEKQKDLFIKHIQWSENLNKPLIIHCVKAAADILQIHKQTSPQQHWMIHGFNGKPGAFELLQKQDFHFSFGAQLLKQNSNQVQHIQNLPLNRILLETDDSNLNISGIYNAASQILKLDISELRCIIRNNFLFLFGVKDVPKLA